MDQVTSDMSLFERSNAPKGHLLEEEERKAISYYDMACDSNESIYHIVAFI